MEIYPKCYYNAERLCFIKRDSPESMEYIYLLTEGRDSIGKTFRPYKFSKSKTEELNINEFVKDAHPISLEEYLTTKQNLFDDAESS